LVGYNYTRGAVPYKFGLIYVSYIEWRMMYNKTQDNKEINSLEILQ